MSTSTMLGLGCSPTLALFIAVLISHISYIFQFLVVYCLLHRPFSCIYYKNVLFIFLSCFTLLGKEFFVVFYFDEILIICLSSE